MVKETVYCKLCHQPMTRLELGADKYPVWVHRGNDLEQCHLIRVNFDFLKRLRERLGRRGFKFERLMKEGRVQLHGETP